MTEVELDAVRLQLGQRGQLPGPVEVGAALRQLGVLVSDTVVRETVAALRRDSTGAGVLDPLLQLPGVTDVLVNAPDQVYLDRGAGLEPAGVSFSGEAEVRRLAVRLAASVGRRLDDGSPFVDARLPSGVRVHAVLPCVADTGTCLSLRVPNRQRLGLKDWVASGSLTPDGADLLAALVASRCAFLISGGTGSGKTTLLGGLLGLVPQTERIVIAEDSRELQPDHPHCLRLEARPANTEGAGAVTLTALVRQALRMRPDRLVVGEVRGAEIADLLSALNTGHEGGCGTVHANSAADVPARLEALAALGGLGREALHAQLAAAVQVLVHVRRLPDGRRWVEELRLVRADPVTGRCRGVPAIRFEPAESPLPGSPVTGSRLSGSPVPGEAYGELVRLVSR
jgi:pilus assembly protein CpaF